MKKNHFNEGKNSPMNQLLPNLKKTVILEGSVHWVQQEWSDEVYKLLIEFLNEEVK